MGVNSRMWRPGHTNISHLHKILQFHPSSLSVEIVSLHLSEPTRALTQVRRLRLWTLLPCSPPYVIKDASRGFLLGFFCIPSWFMLQPFLTIRKEATSLESDQFARCFIIGDQDEQNGCQGGIVPGSGNIILNSSWLMDHEVLEVKELSHV